jgi:hypothetical protein
VGENTLGRIFRWKGDDGSPRAEFAYSQGEKDELMDRIISQAREQMERLGSVDINRVQRLLEAVHDAPSDVGTRP